MHVFRKLIIVSLLATIGLLCPQSRSHQISSNGFEMVSKYRSTSPGEGENGLYISKVVEVRIKREATDDESSVSLWEWLTGQDKPTRCVMVSVGGVIGGGALMGAFVGAGIGSAFTGPGTIVGAFIGGVVGIFSGVSVGHRAGAAACDSPCGTGSNNIQCYPYD
ncbi:uncharacterized protein LOC129723433 [Wyeomyia smithii]|uniref:uncharacterized protein LOC129723433 n=1 Tax=Wyeomyia smithii TaxID=174621 RepID=UPI002467EE86|nr:uncharacterized protein LOC129723433 [Wyeomyia smithii]